MKDEVKFSDLNQQRQDMILSHAHSLTIALQLLEKLSSKQIVNKIIVQGIHIVAKMDESERKAVIQKLDKDLAKNKNSSGIRQLILTCSSHH